MGQVENDAGLVKAVGKVVCAQHLRYPPQAAGSGMKQVEITADPCPERGGGAVAG